MVKIIVKKVIRECNKCKNSFWIHEKDNKPTEKYICQDCLGVFSWKYEKSYLLM